MWYLVTLTSPRGIDVHESTASDADTTNLQPRDVLSSSYQPVALLIRLGTCSEG